MDHWHRHRCPEGAALFALALACALPARAQTAQPSPTVSTSSLPGVAEIDFSLPPKQLEAVGTPTEGSPRQVASGAPDAAAIEPQIAASPVSRGETGRSAPATEPRPERVAPQHGETLASPAQTPALDAEAANPVMPPAQPEAVAPQDKAAAPSGLPAWLFGLALLALAVWFALRRRGSRAGAAEESQEPGAAPLLPDPAPIAVREAHPALRVRPPEPVSEPEPETRPKPAIQRYDGFGRPLAAPIAAPKPAPKLRPSPPPKRRPAIVRYDALGMPIRD